MDPARSSMGSAEPDHSFGITTVQCPRCNMMILVPEPTLMGWVVSVLWKIRGLFFSI